MIILKNIRLYDFVSFIDQAYLAFEEKIITRGDMRDYDNFISQIDDKKTKAPTIIDGQGKTLVPGLVLGHAHIYSSFARGWMTPFDPKTFKDLLEQMWWKLDRNLTLDDVYYSGIAAAKRFLDQGITTVIDHHASGAIRGSLTILKEALVDVMGLRGIFCFETSDRFDIGACIEENRNFADQMSKEGQGKAAGLLGLHASFTLSDSSLRLLAKETPDSLPIHIHVAEGLQDVEETESMYNKSIIERLKEYGLMRPGSLYAHGVYLSQESITEIKNQGGTMVFNPTSNMNNGVGFPPVGLAEEIGVPWIIGNDGLGFGMARDLQNMYYIANRRQAASFDLNNIKEAILQSYIYAENILKIRLGRLDKDYEADFLILDYDPLTPMNRDNAFGHFFYGMLEGWRPESVWVQGRRIYNHGRPFAYTESMAKDTIDHANDLWKRIRQEPEEA